MNVQATLQKLQEMRFDGFTRAYKETLETGRTKDFTADELIAHLVQSEWDDRHNKKLKRLIGGARFRYSASVEEIDFTAKRNLDKNVILKFSGCDWITKKQNIIITGSTGVGKSYVASALGHQACCYYFKVEYENCSKIFDKLKIAKADGTYIKEINKIARQDVLILDDFGLKPLDVNQRLMFLEIIEDRHCTKSTIITSQFPVNQWFEIIGEPTIADAILDRLVNNSHRVELKGESMRKKYLKN